MKSRLPSVPKYEIIKSIGKGGQGGVFLCKLKEVENYQNKYLALKKIYCKNISELNIALQEAQSVFHLNHFHIVKCHSFFIEREENKLLTSNDLDNKLTIDKECVCILYEYCEKGNLHELIYAKRKLGKIIEKEKLIKWFSEIVQGISYCHSKRICHRDLKPANIFLINDHWNMDQTSNEEKDNKPIHNHFSIKIGDFGFAKLLEENQNEMSTILGTQHYLSPEIRQHQSYSMKVDIWGLGCILLDLLLPKTFDYSYEWALNGGKTIKELIEQRYKDDSNDLLELVELIMKLDPEERPDASDILKFLQNHFTNNVKNEIYNNNEIDDNDDKQLLIKKLKHLECRLVEFEELLLLKDQELFFISHPEINPSFSLLNNNSQDNSGNSSSGSSSSFNNRIEGIKGFLGLSVESSTQESNNNPPISNYRWISQKDIKVDTTMKEVLGSLFRIVFGTLKLNNYPSLINNNQSGNNEIKVAIKYFKSNIVKQSPIQFKLSSVNYEFTSAIEHPYIERVYGVMKGSNNTYAIITEACLGDSLSKVLLNNNIRLSLFQKVEYCFGISSAILFIFEKGKNIGLFNEQVILLNEDYSSIKLTTLHTCCDITGIDVELIKINTTIQKLGKIFWYILTRNLEFTIYQQYSTSDFSDINQIMERFCLKKETEKYIIEYLEIIKLCNLTNANKQTCKTIVYRFGKLKELLKKENLYL
ncbi:hypothetical protein ABK040_003349 [Willaertia magna]